MRSFEARLMRPSAPVLLLACALFSAWQLSANAAPATYTDVLPLSLEFYEAQISGQVPAWSSASSWRSLSHGSDGRTVDHDYDLIGGWYTDGGHIKSTMTTATAMSLMAHAAVAFQQTTVTEGLLQPLLQNLDLAAQYLQKCANAQAGKFVAQVGDHFQEELYWGSPEDAPFSYTKYLPGWRPVYMINTDLQYSGGDVVSQAVAALTGTAQLKRKLAQLGVNPSMNLETAGEYEDLAYSLWNSAGNMQAVWPVPEGNRTVYSRTYTDDQVWAAAWLCKLNNDLCSNAISRYNVMKLREGYLTTDVMHAAALSMLLDANAGTSADKDSIVDDLEVRYLDPWATLVAGGVSGTDYCETCLNPSGPCYIPGGLVLGVDQKTPLQYTVGMAYLAMVATSNPDNDARFGAFDAKRYRCAAKNQIDNILGNNPYRQAYVTGLDMIDGYDSSYAFPRNPRHRGSACNGPGQPCASDSEPNPNRLIGALVGGPMRNGTFVDKRTSEPGSLVSVEYNAPFFGALLGLKAFGDYLEESGSNWNDYCVGWSA